MITFNQFKTRLIPTETKQGMQYAAPAYHRIGLHGALFSSVTEAAHDQNLLDISTLCWFVRKDEKQDWKLFQLVEV